MPRKRGKRSQRSYQRQHENRLHIAQRQHASRFLSKESHRDYLKAESINVLTREDIYDVIYEEFGIPYTSVVKAYDKGEVISDGRGEGTHDQPPKKKKRTWIISTDNVE